MNRLTSLRENMKARGFDAVIILDELNQRYLSEFAFTDGLLRNSTAYHSNGDKKC